MIKRMSNKARGSRVERGLLFMTGLHAGFLDNPARQRADCLLELLVLCASLLLCRQGLCHGEGARQQQKR